jgi:small-conductance mechanosensitive channel
LSFLAWLNDRYWKLSKAGAESGDIATSQLIKGSWQGARRYEIITCAVIFLFGALRE